jgi:hypothetical protein
LYLIGSVGKATLIGNGEGDGEKLVINVDGTGVSTTILKKQKEELGITIFQL